MIKKLLKQTKNKKKDKSISIPQKIVRRIGKNKIKTKNKKK